MMTEHPLIEALTKLQYDLTGMQARLAEIKRQATDLNLVLPDVPRCEVEGCGLTFRSQSKLAEHLYLSHDGPDPEHWLQAEAQSAEPIEAQETAA